MGRLGPPRTEIDRDSAYGDIVFGNDRAKDILSERNQTQITSMYEMDGSEVLTLDVEA